MTPTEQLRQAIRDNGISQYELSRLSEVPQSRISDFLSGKAIASDNFDRLCKVLGMRLTKPTRKLKRADE